MIKNQKARYNYYLILATDLAFSCQVDDKSADIYSYQIEDGVEKTKTLKKYYI